MLSKQTFVLLSLCALGGVLASTSENHMVLVDNPDVPNVEQPARTTIDAVPSEVDFRTDIPDFVPTHEWREVMDGQSVPAGLDIRFDFAAGKKYAKLLDGETAPPETHAPRMNRLPAERPAADLPVSMEDAIAKVMADDNAPAFKAPEPIANLTDSLKNMLLELPDPDPDIVDAVSKKLSEEQMEEIYKKVWQKRQQEIANAYSQVRDEVGAMKQMLRVVLERKGVPPGNAADTTKAQTLPTTEDLVNVFEELQISVEDLDTARDFHTIGGFAIMADVLADGGVGVLGDGGAGGGGDGDGASYSGRAPPVSATAAADAAADNFDRNAIKGHAAWVIGTAIKNQEHLQTAALGSYMMEPLLELIKDVKGNPRGAAKGMYALGALLRNHEAAQKRFVEIGGFDTLMDLLHVTFFEPVESRQIQRRRHTVGTKIVALIEDLIIDSHSPGLLEQLSSDRCCNQLVLILSKCQTNNEFEKVFRAIAAASSRCESAWSAGSAVVEGVEALQKQVTEWEAELSGDDDDYLIDLIRQAQSIVRSRIPKP